MSQVNQPPYWAGDYTASSTGATIQNSYNLVPYGEITYNASDRNALGMLICTGEIFDKACFPDLYFAIGTAYNTMTSPAATNSTVGANDFKVPNFLSSFPFGGALGSASGSSNITLNTTPYGGAASVALTAANIASHKHTVPFNSASVSYNAGASYAPAQNQGSTQSDGTIYNNAGTAVTTAGSNGAAFSIIPTYTTVTPLIRAEYNRYSQYQIGYVNIDSTNNKFWIALSCPTPSVTASYVATIQPGFYTPAGLITALNNAISACVLASPLVLTTLVVGYSYSASGRYVLKIRTGVAIAAIQFDFTQQFGTTIPQANLDRCADVLGFYTRTVATGSGTNYYRIDNTGGTQNYIAPPKPMKIYYGSIADGSMTAIVPVTNSF